MRTNIVKIDQGWPATLVGLDYENREQNWVNIEGMACSVTAIFPSTKTVHVEIDEIGHKSLTFDEANLMVLSDRELASFNMGFGTTCTECYVSLYRITRHYGGPEEGGWWYDVKRYMGKTMLVDVMEARSFRDSMEYSIKGDQPKHNRFSVLGDEGDLCWLIEENPGDEDTSRQPKPHYE